MLGRWDPAQAASPRTEVAEHLGHTLGVRDAITLDGAHRAIQALPASWVAPRQRPATGAALAQELQRVRATLVQAITAAPVPPVASRRSRHALPAGNGPAAPAAEPDADALLAPLRTRCVDLQRQMELRIDALRAHVRRQLAGRSPALAQLAALDAAMAQLLAERLERALAAVPDLLERLCMQLRASGVADVAAWGRELQDLLLAELEARLEPVVGLVEAGTRGDAAGGEKKQ